MDVQIIAITTYLDIVSDDGYPQPEPELLIEHAGRVCYHSERDWEKDPTGAKFIKARMKSGHLSILEHASATFEINGISRACSHQLVRHRLASYSQESQRYVEATDFQPVMPLSVIENGATEEFNQAMRSIKLAYQQLLNAGVKPEDARFVLPNACPTRIVMTMNFRELLHFFEVRIHPAAQWEIRNLAIEMRRLVNRWAPTVFQIEEVDGSVR